MKIKINDAFLTNENILIGYEKVKISKLTRLLIEDPVKVFFFF